MNRLVASIALVSAMACLARGDEVAAPEIEADYDCGVRSLCLLLGLEGRRIDPKEIAGSLPPRDPAGYSMKQLRDEAARRGVPLVGVKLRPGERPSGPAIAFLGDGGHGHYIVIRPVGHTGKIVQVLDPNKPPDVIDTQNLSRLTKWTGLALVPDPPRWPLRIGVGLALGGFASLAMIGARRSVRSRSVGARS